MFIDTLFGPGALPTSIGCLDRMRRYLPLLEAATVLVATFSVAVGLRLPTVWLLVPIAIISLTRRSYEQYGLTWRGLGTPTFHLAVMLAVFVPYVIAHYAWAQWWDGAHFHLRLPPNLLAALLDQTLLVGLPEEVFFRGYFQTQCDLVWGKPYRLWGARWGWGLPVAALVFASCHIPMGGPGRLITFFPGLLYGWLRARTGNVVVPTVYHVASNLLMRIMLESLSV